jgi:hypothetical protein
MQQLIQVAGLDGTALLLSLVALKGGQMNCVLLMCWSRYV